MDIETNTEKKTVLIGGSIERVLTARCVEDTLNAVAPGGFGVGAGALASSGAEALPHLADITFLFDRIFVSRLPERRASDITARDTELSGKQVFSPVFAKLSGGTPETKTLGDCAPQTQKAFLENEIWSHCHGAAAVGFVASVKLEREDMAGALMKRSVAYGSCDLEGGSIVDERHRGSFFETDPLRHFREFDRGYMWYTGLSINLSVLDEQPEAADILKNAFYVIPGVSASTGYQHHCHGVLVKDCPRVWKAGAAGTTVQHQASWVELERAAQLALDPAHSQQRFALHIYDSCLMVPQVVAVWSFGPRDLVRVR